MKNFKLLKEWFKFSKPNKKLFILSTMFVVLAYACLAVSPIFAAKVVISVNAADWLGAGINLTIVFAFLVLCYTFWHGNYVVFSKLVESVYSRLNMQFAEKMLNAKPSNFVKNSKEKLLNTVHSDVYNIADTMDRLAICIGRIFMLVVTIIIIFTINVWIGLAVIACDIINFIVLNKIENMRTKRVKVTKEDQDEQFLLFSQMIETRKTIVDFNLQKKVKKRYERYLNKYIGDLNKKTYADSYVSNWFVVFYQLLIFIVTIVVVVLCSQGQIGIETYFLIVPYITSGIETTNTVFEFIPYLKNTEIYIRRIKDILEFKEYPKIEKGSNKNDDIVGYIDFEDVCYSGDIYNPEIKDINFRIAPRKTTLIYGGRNSGKRTIFHLMHRQIEATRGAVLLDGVNIVDYANSVFVKNFNYIGTKPQFFQDTIYNNLRTVCKDDELINSTLEFVGLNEYIKKLPYKMGTLANVLPVEKQYFLSIARTLLTTSEVIAFYEFPTYLTAQEIERLNKMLFALQGTKTIIIFASNDKFANSADKVITIKDGKLTNISVGNNEFVGFEEDEQ